MAFIKTRFADGFRVHGSDLLQGLGRLAVGTYGVIQEARFDDAVTPKRVNIFENTPEDLGVHLTEGKILIPDSRSQPSAYVEAEIFAEGAEPGYSITFDAPVGANPYIAMIVAYNPVGNSNEGGTNKAEIVYIKGAEAAVPVAPDEEDIIADPQINGTSFTIIGAVTVPAGGGVIQQEDIDQNTYQEVARFDAGAVVATADRHSYGYIAPNTNFVQWSERWDPDSGTIAYHTADNPLFGVIWKVFVPPARQIEEAIDLALGGALIVQLTRGDYTVESDITLPPYSTVRGEGLATRIFDGAGTTNFVFRPQTGCRLESFLMQGSGNARNGIVVRNDIASVHELFMKDIFFYTPEAYTSEAFYMGDRDNPANVPANPCDRWNWQNVQTLQGNFALENSVHAYWLRNLRNSHINAYYTGVGGIGLELDLGVNVTIDGAFHDNDSPNSTNRCLDVVGDSIRITFNGTADGIRWSPIGGKLNGSFIRDVG